MFLLLSCSNRGVVGIFYKTRFFYTALFRPSVYDFGKKWPEMADKFSFDLRRIKKNCFFRCEHLVEIVQYRQSNCTACTREIRTF